MPLLLRAWLAANRLGRTPPREDLVSRHAPGRSFADVGCMWGVDGRIAFLAEEAGATPVTGLDLMPPTERFRAEHERRGSRVRFVQGDLHDPGAVAELGRHDVVWCTGLLYHAPNPLLTLQRLREVTGELLILGCETLPNVPGLPQACVFYPGLSTGARRGGAVRVGLDTPFDPARRYENWWWGLTASALRAMLRASGFDPIEERRGGASVLIVARAAPRA
jgi:hypothetical protein